MTDEPWEYNIAAIRELLLAAFTAEDLRRFCLDDPRFRPICDRFGPGHGLVDMVDEVIDYCRTRGLLSELLAAVQHARPDAYGRYERQLRKHTFPAPVEHPSSPDTEPPIWKTVLSKPIVWLVPAALILLAGIWLLFCKPPAVTVALETTHNRYVTAMDGNWDPPWVLRAETGEILACEEFTLLCQCGGQVALQTCHDTEVGNRYVTALGGDHDWLVIGKTGVKDDFERFTILDADTGDQWPCLEVIKALKKDDKVRVAFQTHHEKEGKHRLVTAMGADWDWVLRAETNVLEASEKFTMTLLH